MMTYDMYGPWSDYTGQNSPLWASSVESDWEKNNLNMDAAIGQWIDSGASAGKLIAGIAFYGHSFTLQDPDNNWLHAPITGPGKGGPIIKEEGSWSYLEVSVFFFHKRILICCYSFVNKEILGIVLGTQN